MTAAASVTLVVNSAKGKLVTRLQTATTADWLIFFINPYRAKSEQTFRNIWAVFAAAMNKNTITIFDPETDGPVMDGFNATLGRMGSIRQHLLIPVKAGAGNMNDRHRAFAVAGLTELLDHIPPQTVFDPRSIPVDDDHIDVLPQQQLPVPGLDMALKGSKEWKDHFRQRLAALARNERLVLARKEYEVRCALPLRLIHICTLDQIKVTVAVVAEGVLRLGDRVVVASDPARTAVNGNTVISLRLFPENVPVPVAYPGQYIGIKTGFHAEADFAKTPFFSLDHAVLGRCTAKLTHPKVMGLVVGHVPKRLRGEVSLVGVGGPSSMQTIACDACDSKGGFIFVGMPRHRASSTHCDDFNLFRALPRLSAQKFVLVYSCVNSGLSADNGLVCVPIEESSVYSKLDIHKDVLAIYRQERAEDKTERKLRLDAEQRVRQFLAADFFRSPLLEDFGIKFCAVHNAALQQMLKLELLSVLTGSQEQLGLELVPGRLCGRYTLLYMLSQLRDLSLFQTAMSVILSAAGRDELRMATLPHHWIPTSIYDHTKADPIRVVSEVFAACCTSPAKVKQLSATLAAGNAGKLATMLHTSFLAAGVAMPVYELLKARGERALSKDEIAAYLAAPSLPAFIIRELAATMAFGTLTLDTLLTKASPQTAKHLQRWAMIGVGYAKGQRLTAGSTVTAAVARLTVDNILRLYLFHFDLATERSGGRGGWSLPLAAVQLIAQFI
jgi:hypothetical protein